MISSILSIARVTLIEQIRNRLYLIIVFFGVMMLGVSMLLASLAPGHGTRVIFDLGLVCIELFGLATAVFGAVTLVIQEMESKTIYLIMTRPLPRWVYILGRFSGLVAAVFLTMLAMAFFHVLVIYSSREGFIDFTVGWSFWKVYPVFVLMAAAKMVITTAVALFFSLFATSSVSALIFTGFFWVAGHFGPEMEFMIQKSRSAPFELVMKAASFVFPNFQYFNIKDLPPIVLPDFSFFAWAAVYGLSFAGFYLALSTLLFSRREF